MKVRLSRQELYITEVEPPEDQDDELFEVPDHLVQAYLEARSAFRKAERDIDEHVRVMHRKVVDWGGPRDSD